MKINYSLSSDVAIVALGIDNHLNRRASDEDYGRIKKLSDELYEDSREEYLNPIIQGMYANLFWKDKEDWKGKRQEDLQKEISNFAEELSKLTRLPTDRQESLKKTFLELSKGVMLARGERYGDYRRRLAA